MGRRAKSGEGQLVKVITPHEIPDWVRAVPVPSGEALEELLTEAVTQVSLVYPESPFGAYFSALLRAAELQARHAKSNDEKLLIALQLQNIAPGLSERTDALADWFRSLLAALSELPDGRRRRLLSRLRKKRGRPAGEATRTAVLALSLVGAPALPDGHPRTMDEAQQEAANLLGVSPATVRSAIKRYRKLERERDERITATWAKDAMGATPAPKAGRQRSVKSTRQQHQRSGAGGAGGVTFRSPPEEEKAGDNREVAPPAPPTPPKRS